MTLRQQIKEAFEQFIYCFVLLFFSIAFLKTESGTMWAIGLLLVLLCLYCLIQLCDSLLGIYIAVKFLNKTLKD